LTVQDLILKSEKDVHFLKNNWTKIFVVQNALTLLKKTHFAFLTANSEDLSTSRKMLGENALAPNPETVFGLAILFLVLNF